MCKEIRNFLLVAGICLFGAMASNSDGGSSDIVSIGEKGVIVNEGFGGLLM